MNPCALPLASLIHPTLLLLLLPLLWLTLLTNPYVRLTQSIWQMFGKIFSSMFTGSMVGSGATVFAVWSYVIAEMTPHKDTMHVEINPKLLAFILGEPIKDVDRAITSLCSPDPKSRSKEHEGRRLLRLGEYSYEVVNGKKYRDMRNQEQRREQNREHQARYRERHKLPTNTPTSGEQEYERAVKSGASQDQLNNIVTKSLPTSCQ